MLTSGAGAAALTTTESFTGNLGFIVDFKTSKDSGVPRLVVRGATLALDPADPRIGALLEKSGSWNRLEGQLLRGQLSLKINGQPVTAAGDPTGLATSGPISLIPDGPVEWANLFIRSLPE